jgi:hypothetical protein
MLCLSITVNGLSMYSLLGMCCFASTAAASLFTLINIALFYSGDSVLEARHVNTKSWDALNATFVFLCFNASYSV